MTYSETGRPRGVQERDSVAEAMPLRHTLAVSLDPPESRARSVVT